MGWLSIIFGKSTARSVRKGQRLAKALMPTPAPIPSPSPNPKVKWHKSTNGHDQAEIDGFRVTIFKKDREGDKWNWCIVEVLDEDDIADGEREDPMFGDWYPTKSMARDVAFSELGYN